MRRLALLLLAALPAWAGYTSKAALTFAAASGSTQTNITLAFSGSDTKLKTVANGGQIQNTVTRVGVTVPADFMLTDDFTCATLTGSYAWGIEFYDATTGSVKGWAKIPSLTTGASVVPTVCIGNAAVNTYQGGAVGAEFDASTQASWHYPDGASLSAKDFSSHANDGTIFSATATTGQIDGGASFVAASSQYISVANFSSLNSASALTVSGWVKPTTLIALANLWSALATVNGGFLLFESGTAGDLLALIDVTTGSDNLGIFPSVLTAGAWTYVSFVYDGSQTGNAARLKIYKNGVAVLASSFSGTIPATAGTNGSLFYIGQEGAAGANRFFNGVEDEVIVSSTARSADWIATEYANQNSPPSIGAFAPLPVSGSNSLMFSIP